MSLVYSSLLARAIVAVVGSSSLPWVVNQYTLIRSPACFVQSVTSSAAIQLYLMMIRIWSPTQQGVSRRSRVIGLLFSWFFLDVDSIVGSERWAPEEDDVDDDDELLAVGEMIAQNPLPFPLPPRGVCLLSRCLCAIPLARWGTGNARRCRRRGQKENGKMRATDSRRVYLGRGSPLPPTFEVGTRQNISPVYVVSAGMTIRLRI